MRGTFALLLLSSCSQQDRVQVAPVPTANVPLGGRIVAKVGAVAIERDLVLAIARARGISAKSALDAAIEDAIFAEAAGRARALDDGNLRRRLDAVLTRVLAAKMRAEALAAPFDDHELAEAAAGHAELSRPSARRTVHALVRKAVPNGEDLARALQVRLATAVGPDAKASETAFRDAAKSFVMPEGTKLVVEEIPPITKEGKPVDGDGMIEAAYAKATFALPSALATSEVVETSFGWHVIRLLEIEPAYEATREEKLRDLEPELIAARVRNRWDPLLERLRAAAKPSVSGTDQDLASPRVQ